MPRWAKAAHREVLRKNGNDKRTVAEVLEISLSSLYREIDESLVSSRRLLERVLHRVLSPDSDDLIGAIRSATDVRCHREGPLPP